MPDYRRLVSYIYNYEDGRKRNNVGYARIEARNGLCKCTLHITAPSLNDKQLKVYFFRRDNGGLDGIQIGTMLIKNSAGDLKVQTNSEHIMNSPYSLEHMGGMVLYLSDSKFFATEWDDQPINMEVVSTLEKKKVVKPVEEEKELTRSEKEPHLVAANIEKEEDFKGKKEVGTEAKVYYIRKGTERETNDIKKDTETETNDIKKDPEAETNDIEKGPEAETYDIKEDSKAESKDIKDALETEANDLNKDPGTETYDVKREVEAKVSEVKKEAESPEEKAEEPTVSEIKTESQPVSPEVEGTKAVEKGELNVENFLKLANAITGQMKLKPDTPEQQVSQEPKPVVSNQPTAEDKGEDKNTTTPGPTPVALTEANCIPGRNPERDKWEDEMTRKYYEEERSRGNIPDNRSRERQDRSEKLTKPFFEDHPTAQYMYNNFQRMYPFEDNEVAWCVKIEPQDIGLLPMEAWVLGNNSFLLHGYYSYRHLIFARVNDDKEARYILGVPGIFHNREKFMARMFGFENFKSIKRRDRRSGEFGYWYVPVVLN